MSRALLVIDVQREYFDGALPITHPAGHLEHILDAMDSAAAANVPTAVIRHHQADPNHRSSERLRHVATAPRGGVTSSGCPDRQTTARVVHGHGTRIVAQGERRRDD